MGPDDEEMRAKAAAGSVHERWVSALAQQAPLEFARVVYGLGDCAHGRLDTTVALAVRQAQEQGSQVTRERAEQRARAYLPVLGRAHCPRCWVLHGAKNLLQMTPARAGHGLETARCAHCDAEYVNAP
ncbi:hypothetical protein PGB34_13990 [Xenophilus arseniciresistens]|uniref:Uncharacterized protein n=1 Tax=Xenophilus arseniciresistens TaxID=1283306 RepID=A0AAE3NAU2_9BURK|nr:hypothetical protein [Xenophilus arseniciresistens]MDA7417476.1 hypothetical protein [Xenophilus arseniciresistens]